MQEESKTVSDESILAHSAVSFKEDRDVIEIIATSEAEAEYKYSVLLTAVTAPEENYVVTLKGTVIAIQGSPIGLLCAADRLQFLHNFISKEEHTVLNAKIEFCKYNILPTKKIEPVVVETKPELKKTTKKFSLFTRPLGHGPTTLAPKNKSATPIRRKSWSALPSFEVSKDEIPQTLGLRKKTNSKE